MGPHWPAIFAGEKSRAAPSLACQTHNLSSTAPSDRQVSIAASAGARWCMLRVTARRRDWGSREQARNSRAPDGQTPLLHLSQMIALHRVWHAASGEPRRGCLH
jgi:hypothetical protein